MKGIRKCVTCKYSTGKPSVYVRCSKRKAKVHSTFAYICEYYEERVLYGKSNVSAG